MADWKGYHSADVLSCGKLDFQGIIHYWILHIHVNDSTDDVVPNIVLVS